MTLFANQSAIPAHILALQEAASNIASREGVPSLTYRGKVWRMVNEGEEQVIMKDGDPASSVEVVILDQSAFRGRSYYEGEYVEGESRPPTCASTDGIRPDADIKEPRALSCAQCPFSAKGSSKSGKGAACSGFKNIAVVAADLSTPPLRLRMAQTSLFDATNPEESKGWFAYDQYINQLRARNVTSTAAVVTKIKFDMDKAYPKLLFSAVDWVAADKTPTIMELRAGETIPQLLGKKEAAPATPPAIAAPVAVAPAVAPAPVVAPAVAAPAAPAPVVAPVAVAAPAVAPAPVVAPVAVAAPAVAPPPVAPVVAPAGGSLDDLLKEWDT
jgi:hypothetical protein